tara:strand:+ start:761 stop:1303 length:543 start_codon:yes stop_codon:yes gene_type:complete
MKYFKILIIPFLLIALLSISCERDDICPESTPTTPSLIIDVFDFNSQENKKNIFNLVIVGVDNDDILPGFSFVSSNNLVLPLKTTANTTQYTLIKGASVNDNGTPEDLTDDFIDGNYDTITINYSRKELFVSKACGFKTIFENVTLTIEDDTDNWILSQTPLNPNQSVEDETTTHFNIFH